LAGIFWALSSRSQLYLLALLCSTATSVAAHSRRGAIRVFIASVIASVNSWGLSLHLFFGHGFWPQF